MIVLGLGGGIAAGKSTVSAWLVRRGATLVDADVLARQVVAPGTPGLAQVIQRFGERYLRDAELDRKALGALVFADPSQRRDLEAIVHPAIRVAIDRALSAAQAAGERLAVLDAALLFEMALDRQCDATLAIVARPATQLARIAARDGLPADAAQLRLQAQLDGAALRARATWTIDNDGSLADLEAALQGWWQQFAARFPQVA